MTTYTVVVISLLAIGLGEGAVGGYLWYTRRALRRQLLVERLRGEFARSRNALMDLVRSGELSADTDTFRMLYVLQTHAMRRPDQYPELATMIRNALDSTKPDGGSVLRGEADGWTDGTRDVVVLTMGAWISLLISHHFILRQLFRLGDWVTRLRGGHPNEFTLRLLHRVASGARRSNSDLDAAIRPGLEFQKLSGRALPPKMAAFC